MDIPNLSVSNTPQTNQKNSSLPLILIIVFLGIASGFWLSRYFPLQKESSSSLSKGSDTGIVPADSIKDKEDIKVGKVYGDNEKDFKDTAVGKIEKGSINGEGTHILNRDGGASQRVSLTSSVVDLDMFVGYKVEVKGQTNSSSKTGWLMDVGSIKRLE